MGPFDKEELPFDNFIQSPIGLVPKTGNKMRLIFHLSYEFEDRGSVNSNTPKEKCTVKYRDLDHAVKNCLEVLDKQQSSEFVGSMKTVRFCKTDLTSAFRILPMKIEHCCWLVMMAVNPKTRMKQYFIDKCLPFGASISCTQFQMFSDALQHITEYKLQVKRRITNYLDDFLFVAKTILLGNFMMKQFLKICEDIGCPVSEEKTEWGYKCLVFLGTLMDGDNLCLAIAEEKRKKAITQLMEIVLKKKIRVKELQSLTGLLNFLTRAIVPGHPFTRRLFAKTPSYIYKMQQKKLKFYHHV